MVAFIQLIDRPEKDFRKIYVMGLCNASFIKLAAMKFIPYYLSILSFLLFSLPVAAQLTVHLAEKVDLNKVLEKSLPACGLIRNHSTAPRMIQGTVSDTAGHPIPFATITIGTRGVVADSVGRFILAVPDSCNQVTASAIGYMPLAKMTKDSSEICFRLTPLKKILPEVEVGCTASKRIGCGMVCVSGSIRVISEPVPRAVPASPINIFPNPAARGSLISIEYPGFDISSVILHDNNAKSIKLITLNNGKGNVIHVTIPQQLAAGTYYLSITDRQTRKSHTGKIIIQ